MIIYFHIDELARDAIVASALRKTMLARGGRIVYGNRFTTDYMLRHTSQFDAIILPSLLHFYYAFPDAGNLPTNVFILQTEAIGQSTKTLKRLNGKYFGDEPKKYDAWHKAVRGYLLWGPAHLSAFHEHHPEYLPKCKVVGHPRLSSLCAPPALEKTDPRPAIGFVSRFNLLSPFDGRTAFESAVNSMRFGNKVMTVYEGSDGKDVEDMFYTEVIDFRVMLQLIRSLDPQKYRIFVRPHPRENRYGWQGLAKKLGLDITVSQWDKPFAHWLAELDVIVTPPSTGLYDIFFHGRRALVMDRIVPTRNDHTLAQSDDNNQILESLCRPQTIEEALRRIEQNDIPPADENVSACLQAQVGADIASHAIDNILDAITQMLGKTNPRSTWQLYVWEMAAVLLSELKECKRRLQKRIEQGSSFNLTMARKAWIHKLVNHG